MYYHFAIGTDFDDNTDYEAKFGEYIGNFFAETMEDCFYCNPIHESEECYYGIPLDNVMTLPQFLTAVFATYSQSQSKHCKSKLSEMFSLYTDKSREYSINDVREEIQNGRKCFVYRNIENHVVEAIIWGAYFLACIEAELHNNKIPARETRDFLLKFLIGKTGLTDKAFHEKHVLTLLHKEYFVPIMRKIVKVMCKDYDSDRMIGNHSLDYYINHPVYGLAYDSIASYLSIVSMKDGIELTDDHYLAVFHEAESCVNRVLDSKTPELEIPRVHTYINKKYANNEKKGENVTVIIITSKYCIGCIIEMLFMVALYDLMPEKTTRVMKALTNLRVFIENHDNSYIYKNDEMWRLVDERIPNTTTRPLIEELKAEIQKLKDENEQLKTLSENEPVTIIGEDEIDDDGKNFPHRLKIAYLLQLWGVKKAEEVKNERALSRALEMLADIPRTSVQLYLKDFSLKVAHHKDKIGKFNKELTSLGLPELSQSLETE